MAFPSCRGTYILILWVACGFGIRVGALGLLNFPPGLYAYVGSAFGPGGLRARLSHHLSPVHTNHWHIDYLTQNGEVVEIWYTCDPAKREHEWAAVFAGLPGVSGLFPGFGASDCQCRTHLFHLLADPRMDDFYLELRNRELAHKPVSRLLPEYNHINAGSE